MKKRVINFQAIAVIAVLTVAIVGMGQNNNSNNQNKPNIKFLIMPVNENDQKRKTTFKVGGRVRIKTVLKNDRSEPLPHIIMTDSYQYKLQLQKVGDKSIRPFRQDRAVGLFNAERSGGNGGLKMAVEPIPSGKYVELKSFYLDEFFDSLEPGKYKLIMLYYLGGKFGKARVISNHLILDIVP